MYQLLSVIDKAFSVLRIHHFNLQFKIQEIALTYIHSYLYINMRNTLCSEMLYFQVYITEFNRSLWFFGLLSSNGVPG